MKSGDEDNKEVWRWLWVYKKIKEGGTCKTLLCVWGVEGICFIEYDYIPMIYIV